MSKKVLRPYDEILTDKEQDTTPYFGPETNTFYEAMTNAKEK